MKMHWATRLVAAIAVSQWMLNGMLWWVRCLGWGDHPGLPLICLAIAVVVANEFHKETGKWQRIQ